MRQKNDTLSKKLLRIIGIVLLVLISLYVAVQCYVIFHRTYKTETAIYYTMSDSVSLQGIVSMDTVRVEGSGDLGY